METATTRISLSELKDSASDPNGFTWRLCGPEVLALIAVAEAARKFTSELKDSAPSFYPNLNRLTDALDLFQD